MHEPAGMPAKIHDLVELPLRALRRRIVRLSGVHSGERVLDVGTGTGAQAFAFAAAGAEVVGVDMTPDALAVARRRNRFAHATFLLANASELPLADAGFDVACIAFTLHEMPPAVRYEVLGEMARVTRPTGTIVAADYVLPPNALAAASVERAARLLEHEHRTGFTRADLRATLESAGIEVRADHGALLGGVRILIGVRR